MPAKSESFVRRNRVQILFLASSVIVLFLTVYCGAMMRWTTQMLEESVVQRVLALSRAAAGVVPADELSQLLGPQDMEKPLYDQVRRRLHAFSEDAGTLFTYYMREVDGKLQFIVDSDFDTETQVGLATEPVDYEEAPLSALSGVAMASGLGSYSSNWDGLLSAFAPVYGPGGVVVAIAGVDIQDSQILRARRNTNLLIVILILSIVLVFSTGLLSIKLYQKKAKLSETANVSKSQFLSRMSHEIRTPLNAIIGLCRMARAANDVGKIHGHLENIGSSSNHLLSLVNDILDMSKIESGKMTLELVPVRSADEIQSIEAIILPQIRAKGLGFQWTVGADLPVAVEVDQVHLRQVIINLLSNAVKFTPEGGRIDVSTHVLDRGEGRRVRLEFRVKDSGIGIAESHIQKLFDPFEQGDGSTTRKFGGSGLGLAISRQFIEMMGGTIRVESVLGKGSEFIFDLWLCEVDLPAQAAQEAPAALDLKGRCILLVEDVEINQVIASSVFEELGAEVDCANHGREGLEKFQAAPEKYAFIFMDIQMPVMDGYAATRAIRDCAVQRAKTIPIIGMSANVFQEDIKRAYEAGMNGYVGKPFDEGQVEREMARVAQLMVG